MSIVFLVLNRYWFIGNNVCFVINIFIMKRVMFLENIYVCFKKNVSK